LWSEIGESTQPPQLVVAPELRAKLRLKNPGGDPPTAAYPPEKCPEWALHLPPTTNPLKNRPEKLESASAAAGRKTPPPPARRAAEVVGRAPLAPSPAYLRDGAARCRRREPVGVQISHPYAYDVGLEARDRVAQRIPACARRNAEIGSSTSCPNERTDPATCHNAELGRPGEESFFTIGRKRASSPHTSAQGTSSRGFPSPPGRSSSSRRVWLS